MRGMTSESTSNQEVPAGEDLRYDSNNFFLVFVFVFLVPLKIYLDGFHVYRPVLYDLRKFPTTFIVVFFFLFQIFLK